MEGPRGDASSARCSVEGGASDADSAGPSSSSGAPPSPGTVTSINTRLRWAFPHLCRVLLCGSKSGCMGGSKCGCVCGSNCGCLYGGKCGCKGGEGGYKCKRAYETAHELELRLINLWWEQKQVVIKGHVGMLFFWFFSSLFAARFAMQL